MKNDLIDLFIQWIQIFYHVQTFTHLKSRETYRLINIKLLNCWHKAFFSQDDTNFWGVRQAEFRQRPLTS